MACIHATHLSAIATTSSTRDRSFAREEGGLAPSVSGRGARSSAHAAVLPSRTFLPRTALKRARIPRADRNQRTGVRCANDTAVSQTEQGDDVRWVMKGERWHVRYAKPEELKRVSTIQAESFHESNPIEALNKMFLGFFQAEVYGALINKSKYTKDNRFACLAAQAPEADSPIVGVAEVSIQGDNKVNELLDVSEYCYVCCMAVDPSYRRQSIATELLRGAEVIAKSWGYDRLCLHVYDVNKTAQECYKRAGYEVLAADSKWEAAMAGRPRRFLLGKQVD
eukprot:CAMPEP_0118928428 /NCGR_PEP_ID=MMETSP1169-20130426/5675_1 /TAXON_ID=36882 /ORGANISM="Pyramimonas obovata, Strain CCMP722" /LENGTH=280 /DNA_ID=CAMNT_0006870389 /DNA_START=29 /DNA_END=871 /DNA_ORIENTATION=-